MVMRSIVLTFMLLCCTLPALGIDRPADPVVLTGANVPVLQGITPHRLVAFRYDGGWRQIPVQVDERAVINFTQVYNGSTTYGSLSRLDYTDAGTFTGPDSNPLLDADDEIVFMVKDAGPQCDAATAPPANVLADNAVELTVTDPLGGSPGYVYLFEQDGTLDPSAGAQYVAYNFNLLSGDYRTTYKTMAGPNPEDSYITTPFYRRHFSDRWKDDGLWITAGTAANVDIIDRHKNLFAPGVCGRSEDTFSAAEGAFIINKSGPVRAIRGFVGANSGPRTQRVYRYYAQREDVVTYLRVHSIPGIMDFRDYSADALGMTYFNNNNTAGLVIDGVADTVAPGLVAWELVTGAPGSLVLLHTFTTNATPFSVVTYYLDAAAPVETQCTGDTHAYGSSGNRVISAVPNTDPVRGPAYDLSVQSTLYFEPPQRTPGDAQQRKAQVDAPLTFICRTWPEGNEIGGEGEGEGEQEGESEGEGEGEACTPTPICDGLCESAGISAGFEAALRVVYANKYLKLNPDITDWNNNGLIDAAHARLLDAVLATPGMPVHCCVLAVYQSNLALAQAYCDTVYVKYPTLGGIIAKPSLVIFLAGLATLGDRLTIQNIATLVTLAGSNVPPLDLDVFDYSQGVYLDTNGDADLDGICNLGEYNAASADFGVFVAAAIEPNSASDGGGCPDCGSQTEGEDEPIPVYFTVNAAWCEKSEPVQFSGHVTGVEEGIIEWQWDFGDGTILSTDDPVVTHAYAANGVYTVKLTVVSAKGRIGSVTQANMIMIVESLPFLKALPPALGTLLLVLALLLLSRARIRRAGFH